MNIGNPRYAEYIGSIFRVIIYIGDFSCTGGAYSGMTASLNFNIKVNGVTKKTIIIYYDDSNESDIHYDSLIDAIKMNPKDKVKIEMIENYPSATSFSVDNIDIKLKCSKIPS